MLATGKASGPGHAHYRRVGALTGWMTARQTNKQARKTVSPLMAGVFIFRERLKSHPNGIQDPERPRVRGHGPPGTKSASNVGTARSLPSEPPQKKYQSLGPKHAQCLSLPIQRREMLDQNRERGSRSAHKKCTASCSLPLNQRGQSGLKTTGGRERSPQVPTLRLAGRATPAQTNRPSRY